MDFAIIDGFFDGIRLRGGLKVGFYLGIGGVMAAYRPLFRRYAMMASEFYPS